MKPILRNAWGALLLLMLIFVPLRGWAAAQHLGAFESFVQAGNFQQANFYLNQGYVTRDEIDTSAMYFRAIHQPRQRLAMRPDVYQYLSSIHAIDLNRRFDCEIGNSRDQGCYLINLLALDEPIGTFKFFADRGLNLNGVYEDAVPAPFLIVNRLGSKSYSLANINQLTALGMVFGDEMYDPSLLTDPKLNSVILPLDTGSVTAFHFMDILAISLANVDEDYDNHYRRFGLDKLSLSRRDELMCSFISHSAQNFAPSFDYLGYLLDQRSSFRAKNLTAVPDTRSKVYYRPFPHACVQLVSALARSYPELQAIVSKFAAEGDVDTARWLLSFQQQR